MLGGSITAALVALVAAAAQAGDPPAEAVLADLPFLESEPNRIYLDLAPEKSRRRLRILLDTGATFSVFTPRAAREIGVKARRTKRDPYRRRTILGTDLHFYIDTKSSDTASRTGWEYGLLGGNFLGQYVLELDFPKRRVRFIDPDAWSVPESVDAAGEAVVPIIVVSNRPGLDIDVNGRTLQVLFDTGANLGLLLSGDMAKQAGITSAPQEGFRMAGVMGAVESEVGQAERVRLGPFELGRLPVAVAPKGWFNQGFPGDSILGYALMAEFTIRIDYARGRMWLRRKPEAAGTTAPAGD